MMRALIVDDEIYAREEMETLLKETGEFTVRGEVRQRPGSDAGHQAGKSPTCSFSTSRCR